MEYYFNQRNPTISLLCFALIAAISFPRITVTRSLSNFISNPFFVHIPTENKFFLRFGTYRIPSIRDSRHRPSTNFATRITPSSFTSHRPLLPSTTVPPLRGVRSLNHSRLYEMCLDAPLSVGSLLKYRSAKVPKIRTTQKRVRLERTNYIGKYMRHPVRLLDAWAVEE